VPYTVVFAAPAARQLRALRAAERAGIIDQCRRLLSTHPTLTSRARIKRLAGDVVPPYRLRVGDYRVFYDIEEEAKRVLIYGVVTKAHADEWLAAAQQEGEHEEGDRS
jgi:mRNA-degrading endonuclease RelE of RelBE toxin-antitoxin system